MLARLKEIGGGGGSPTANAMELNPSLDVGLNAVLTGMLRRARNPLVAVSSGPKPEARLLFLPSRDSIVNACTLLAKYPITAQVITRSFCYIVLGFIIDNFLFIDEMSFSFNEMVEFLFEGFLMYFAFYTINIKPAFHALPP